MRKIIMALSLAALVAPAAPVLADPPPWAPAHGKRAKDERKWHKKHDRGDWREYRRYDWDRRDPRYGGYYPDRYYRDGRNYQTRRLSYNDRIYRGRDGRYYCRRDDGTTGLIIGAAVGGLLGNRIAPGDSRTIGTIIGAGAGALLGREIDRGEVRCR
jgi:hypothetical protein